MQLERVFLWNIICCHERNCLQFLPTAITQHELRNSFLIMQLSARNFSLWSCTLLWERPDQTWYTFEINLGLSAERSTLKSDVTFVRWSDHFKCQHIIFVSTVYWLWRQLFILYNYFKVEIVQDVWRTVYSASFTSTSMILSLDTPSSTVSWHIESSFCPLNEHREIVRLPSLILPLQALLIVYSDSQLCDGFLLMTYPHP